MVGKLVRARRQTDVDVDRQTATAGEPSLISHAIAGAKNGLVLASPGKRPAQAHVRRDVVRVVLVEFFTRVRRMFADKLHRGQRTPDPGLVPVGDARSRESEQAVASANRRRHHSVPFIRDAVPLPSYAEVEREIRPHLPIVLEEPAQLVLVEIPVLLIILAVIQPLDVLRIGPEAEGLANVGHGARDVGQQVLRPLHIGWIDAREVRAFHMLDLYSARGAVVFPLHIISWRAAKWSWTQGTGVGAWTEMDSRDNFVGVPGIAGLAAEVDAPFERMFAAGPTDVVSIVPQGRAVADTAVIREDHAALTEQRPFDRPRNRAASAHK